KWDVILMSPGLFAVVFGLGSFLGMGITRIFLNERLARHEIRITDLQGVLDGKIPAEFVRKKSMSPSLIVVGLVLVLVGLVLAAIGVLPVRTSPKSITTAARVTPPTSTPAPQLLPDDGGPIKWYPGQYVLGASGGDDVKGMVITTFQLTGQ